MNQSVISPDEMIGILKEKDYEHASSFVKIAQSLGCTPEVRYAKAHRIWKCGYSKLKPKRVLLTIECNETRWSIKANLFHIDQYRQAVESCSDEIKNPIKTSYDCRSCAPRCKGGVIFSLDGEQYGKCKGCGFYFRDLSDDGWKSLLSLIEYESKF